MPGSFLSHSICHTRATRTGRRLDPQNDGALQAGRGHDGASGSPQLASARGLWYSQISPPAKIFSDFSTWKWGVDVGRGLHPACPEEAEPYVRPGENRIENSNQPLQCPRSHLSQAGNIVCPPQLHIYQLAASAPMTNGSLEIPPQPPLAGQSLWYRERQGEGHSGWTWPLPCSHTLQFAISASGRIFKKDWYTSSIK